MRKFNQKQNEKGALIIEVIAVVALLGVMGPMLFKQVKNRNEEVDNVAMASEMRTIKEAFSAYILADRAKLMTRCINQTGAKGGDMDINSDELEPFLPAGNEAIYSYNLVLNCEAGLLQGFISPIVEAAPANLKLKRSARIANLIGADGGICQGGEINGVAGGWHTTSDIDGDKKLCPQQPWVVATTGMDTFTPEVTYEDYSASIVTLPEDLALRKLHAFNYFSVGGGSACYKINHTNTGSYSETQGFTAQNDTITGNNDDCKPAFWVGAPDASDGAENGHVYVKNNLIVGKKKDKQAIGLFAEGSDTETTTGEPEKNRIEVYDNTGKSRIIINGKGEIIAQDAEAIARVRIDGSGEGKIIVGNITSDSTDETLTLTHQMLLSSEEAKNGGSQYKIDPSRISVMNDIKLDSRGGARLSDLLPNYISKNVIALDTGNCSGGRCKVTIPSCPEYHAPAIIVIPTHWETKPTISASAIAEKLSINASGKIAGEGLITSKGGLFMYINEKDELDTFVDNKKEATDTSGSEWEIYFKNAGEAIRTDVKAIAQTYCVYDKNAHKEVNSTEREE